MWTHFYDMHSGGKKNLAWGHIYIEATEEVAIRIFRNAFGIRADDTSCECCGPDYSISQRTSLEQATGYDRNCRCIETPILPNGRYDTSNPALVDFWLEDGQDPPIGFRASPSYSTRPWVSLSDYVKRDDVKVIYADQILPEWLT